VDERVAETVFHGRHVVLGRRLRPLTYFHQFALAAIGSAFVDPAREVTYAELALAVAICSRTRPQICSYLARPKRWRDRAASWLSTRIFARHYLGELAAFHAYLRDHHAPPEFFTSDKTRVCKTPWPLPQIARLMHHGHMTLDEAWDSHPGFAAWLIPALQEAAGHEVNIISEAEARALKEAGW
jgi:hypothetical protein